MKKHTKYWIPCILFALMATSLLLHGCGKKGDPIPKYPFKAMGKAIEIH
jgi:hypothetical protein